MKISNSKQPVAESLSNNLEPLLPSLIEPFLRLVPDAGDVVSVKVNKTIFQGDRSFLVSFHVTKFMQR